MKLYASFETNGQGGWGDSFPSFFFCEWLKQNDPDDDLEIWMWDQGARGTGGGNNWRLRDYIEKPAWIAGWLDGPPEIVRDGFNVVLATHYNHPQKAAPVMSDRWDPEHGGWLPPAKYKGAENLGILRLHNDAWWATLIDKMGWRPTMPTLIEPPYVAIQPPYVAIQLRRDEPGDLKKPGRNKLSGEEFDEWARGLIKGIDGRVVLLSDLVDVDCESDVIDCSELDIWQKIHIAHNADIFVGAHSGFGGVCASYAKKSFVVNISKEGAHRNPPIYLFDNVKCEIEGEVYTASGPYLDPVKELEVKAC